MTEFKEGDTVRLNTRVDGLSENSVYTIKCVEGRLARLAVARWPDHYVGLDKLDLVERPEYLNMTCPACLEIIKAGQHSVTDCATIMGLKRNLAKAEEQTHHAQRSSDYYEHKWLDALRLDAQSDDPTEPEDDPEEGSTAEAEGNFWLDLSNMIDEAMDFIPINHFREEFKPGIDPGSIYADAFPALVAAEKECNAMAGLKLRRWRHAGGV